MINFPFLKKRNKTRESDGKKDVLMILNKHTKENQLSRKSLNVCARDFHDWATKRCPRLNWIEEDNDWKHIWLRLDFMIDVVPCLAFLSLSYLICDENPWSLIKHEERKSIKIFFRLIDLWFAFMTFYYIRYIEK